MRFILLLICGIFLIGCKKKSEPKPPEAVSLVFPNRSSECTTGVDLNQNTSEVEFRWMASNHTDTYELRVTNINTNVTQTINTQTISAKLPIAKGEPFSWQVRSRNSKVTEVVSSSTWMFYNAGSETTYAPFPAEVVEPTSGTSVFRDINNEVTLAWQGADIENDIVGYDIFFSTTSPPETLIDSPSAGTTTEKVSVDTGTMYYWQVVTKDAEGNSSQSGIFTFKVL